MTQAEPTRISTIECVRTLAIDTGGSHIKASVVDLSIVSDEAGIAGGVALWRD